MLLTFHDLWKQWQGANQKLILNTGKEAPTGCQSPFHAWLAWECHSHVQAAQHSRAWRTHWGHSSRWQRWQGWDSWAWGFAPRGVSSTPDGPLKLPEPDIQASTSCQALLTSQPGQDAWILEQKTQSTGSSCSSLSRVTYTQNNDSWRWSQMNTMESDH